MQRRISVSKYGGPDKLSIPVTCPTTKKLADDKVDVIDNLSTNEKEVIGAQGGKMDKKKLKKQKTFTVDEDVKNGLIGWKEQAHIRSVRQQNIDLYTHTERLRKEHDHFIRQVRQTGVTLVTNQAKTYGFGKPEEANLWANFGQGAPECGPIPGGPPREMSLTLDEDTLE